MNPQNKKENALTFPLLLQLFDMCNLGIMLLGPERKLVLWNQWLVDVSGLSRDDVLGKTLDDVFPDIENTRLRDAINEVYTHQLSSTLSPRLHSNVFPLTNNTNTKMSKMSKKAGQLVTLSPLTMADGKIFCLIQVSDVTPALNREDQLRLKSRNLSLIVDERISEQRQSEERFKDFAESSSDWFWEMDEDFRFTSISEGYRNLIGFDPSIFIGKTRREASKENQSNEKWLQHFDDLENHRRIHNFSYGLTTPNGQRAFIRINGKPVFDHGGIFCGYRGTGSDITEQVLAEEALQNNNESLEQRVKDRTSELDEEIMERKQTEIALQQKADELETFNQTMVDREMRMIELKEEVNELASSLGHKKPYQSVWNDG